MQWSFASAKRHSSHFAPICFPFMEAQSKVIYIHLVMRDRDLNSFWWFFIVNIIRLYKTHFYSQDVFLVFIRAARTGKLIRKVITQTGFTINKPGITPMLMLVTLKTFMVQMIFPVIKNWRHSTLMQNKCYVCRQCYIMLNNQFDGLTSYDVWKLVLWYDICSHRKNWIINVHVFEGEYPKTHWI